MTRDEIEIQENGQARPVELFAKDEIPTVYGILLDRGMLRDTWESGYTKSLSAPGATSARDIAFELIDKYMGRQVVWVGVYDKEMEVALDFSTDGFRAKDAIQNLRGPRRPPQSFLYGALLAAVQKMTERSEKRKVLLLFLDIVDVETAGKAKPLHNLFAASNAELFVVSFAAKLGGDRTGGLHPQMSQSLLKDLAQVTAGEAFFASDYREHLDDISRRILNQIRTFYTFGFQSTAEAGSRTKLSIRCTRPGAKTRHHPSLLAAP